MSRRQDKRVQKSRSPQSAPASRSSSQQFPGSIYIPLSLTDGTSTSTSPTCSHCNTQDQLPLRTNQDQSSSCRRAQRQQRSIAHSKLFCRTNTSCSPSDTAQRDKNNPAASAWAKPKCHFGTTWLIQPKHCMFVLLTQRFKFAPQPHLLSSWIQ